MRCTGWQATGTAAPLGACQVYHGLSSSLSLRLGVQVAQVTVKGPRYWEQTISAGQDKGGALAALYSSGTLPVQLQRWALSYVQDPSGVRGLLSQAFDEVYCTDVHNNRLASKARL